MAQNMFYTDLFVEKYLHRVYKALFRPDRNAARSAVVNSLTLRSQRCGFESLEGECFGLRTRETRSVEAHRDLFVTFLAFFFQKIFALRTPSNKNPRILLRCVVLPIPLLVSEVCTVRYSVEEP